jgi:hypothetical protein
VDRLQFVVRSSEFHMPGTGLVLSRDDAGSWDLQGKLRGAGAPTTTTLLAALWPQDHHILDWRVLAAAVALTLDDPQLGHNIKADTCSTVVPSIAQYEWVRQLLIEVSKEVELPLVTVERALYGLTKKKQVGVENGRSWADYAKARRAAAAPADQEAPAGEAGADDEEDAEPSAP